MGDDATPSDDVRRGGVIPHPWAKTGPFPNGVGAPADRQGADDTSATPDAPLEWRNRAGGAYDAARGAGVFGTSGPQWRGRASLDVRVRADGRVNTQADGGDLFQDVNVNRGRSMAQAQEH